MSDTISREAAIDALRTCYDTETITYTNGNEYIDYEQALDLLDSLPSAQRWTPISEGLPKKNGRYLVTRGLNACGALWNRVYIINFSDLMGLKSERIWWDGNVGKSGFEHITDVLAWMPLPEPWRGEEDV